MVVVGKRRKKMPGGKGFSGKAKSERRALGRLMFWVEPREG